MVLMQSASSELFTWLSLHYFHNDGINSYYCIRVAVISAARLNHKLLGSAVIGSPSTLPSSSVERDLRPFYRFPEVRATPGHLTRARDLS